MFWRRLHNRKIRRQLAFERAGNELMHKTHKSMLELKTPFSESLETLWNSIAEIEKNFPELSDLTKPFKEGLAQLSELQDLISEKD
jgi:hypothetical protein